MKEGKIALYEKPSFIFLILIPVLLIVCRYIIGFNGLYGQDAHEYLRYTNAIHVFFIDNTPPGEFHWETMYPALGALLSFICSASFSLQLISIASLSGTLFFIHKILVLLYGDKKEALIYVLVFGLFSTYFLRLGLCAMSDMLTIFFVIASIYYILKLEKGANASNLMLVLVFSTAAVLTRLPSAIVLFIPVLRIIVKQFQKTHVKVWFFSILICVLLYFSMYFLKKDQHLNMFEALKEWNVKNFFADSFANPGNGNEHYNFSNIIFILFFFIHPGYVLISAALIPFIRKTDLFNIQLFNLLIPIFIYLFFLTGLMHQNVRLNTLALPLWIIFLFPAFLRFKEKLLKTTNLWLSMLLIVIVSQLVLFYFGFNKFVAQAELERQIAGTVNEKYAGMPIYTLGMEGAMLSYSNAREIHSLGVAEPECGAEKLILIPTEKFEIQWKNLRPFRDWYFYQQNCDVHKLMSFDQGWDLYECK